MSSLFSLAKDRINFWLLLPGLILLLILPGMLLIDFRAILPVPITEMILSLHQPNTTLTLISLFLAISTCYLLLFLSYTHKPKLRDYELITPPGFYKHKKNGNYYCQKCLLKDHIAVPLSALSTEDFHCRLCDQSYKFDYEVLLCHSYLSIVAKKNDPLFKNHEKAVNEYYNYKDKKC